MTSSAQLEQEAEQTRAQLAQTLDELRERITPGQLVDQAVDYAKDSGGGLFVRNLGNQVTANPLPVALIGAGVAWLMLSNGARSARSTRVKEGAIDRARRAAIDTAARMADAGQAAGARARTFADTAQGTASESVQQRSAQAREVAGSAAQGAASAFESAKSSAAAAYDQFSDTASEAYDRVSNSASRATSTVSETASSFGQSTAAASRDMLQFCKTQPLVLAGIGMALGAILGALIPPTETEDRLMGESSDQLKDQARDIAEDQIQQAKSATASALNEAEAEFQFADAGAGRGVPAETSLVPNAEHSAEQRGSSEAAEHER
ncbi:MAG: DUF3618 domain-containing protein [Xanthobacteraceae bacterium]